MILTKQDLRECLAYETNWCALPWTRAEKAHILAECAAMAEHALEVPGWPAAVPGETRVLMEQVLQEQQQGAPPAAPRAPGRWTGRPLAEVDTGSARPPSVPGGWTHTGTAGGVHTYRHPTKSGKLTVGPGSTWRHHAVDGTMLASGADPASLHAHLADATPAAESQSAVHARLHRAVTADAVVLTEHRAGERGTRDVASLSYEEKHALLTAFVRGEPHPLHGQLTHVIQEQRTEAPVLPAGSHQKLFEAIHHGDTPTVAPGVHERLARAIRG